MTEPAYRGVYINLDRSPERRKKFEQQLDEFGLGAYYSRFTAVDGSTLDLSRTPLRPGEVGVFLSHCRALESMRDAAPCVHLLEDDALLSEHVAPVIVDAVAGKLFERYDLIFTDMTVHCHVGFLKSIKKQFDSVMAALPPGPARLQQLRLIDQTQVFHAAVQSYIVGRNSIDKLVALYREEIEKGPSIPVDIFLQEQVLSGKLRAACIFPFITSFRLEDTLDSTIFGTERVGQATISVMDVLRYLFFIRCDLGQAKRILDAATRANREPPDLRHALIAQAAEFVLSNDFVGT